MLPDKKMIRYLVILLASISVATAEPANPLTAYLANINTLKVNFTQRLLSEKGKTLTQHQGVLYLQRPDKFNWSYQSPYVQSIISDGQVLWIYDADLEQLTIKPVAAAMIAKTPAAVLLGNTNFEEHFTQRNLGNKKGLAWIELTPKDNEAQYKNILVGFKEQVLDRIVAMDHLGQITQLDFDSSQKNIHLSATLFNFEIPAGTDVIDLHDLRDGLD